MKRLLLLFACMVALQATAQKVTEKNLQGKWNIVSMSIYIGTVDFKKQEFIPTDEFKGDMTKEDLENIEASMLESLAGAAKYYVDFKEGYMLETNMDTEGGSDSTYKIIEKDGKQYLTDAQVEDDEQMELFIKKKQLHFVIPDDENGGNIVMIFEK